MTVLAIQVGDYGVDVTLREFVFRDQGFAVLLLLLLLELVAYCFEHGYRVWIWSDTSVVV